MESPDAILRFWFGESENDAEVASRQAELWWSKDAEVDAQMRERFEALVVAAGSGRLDDWRSQPEGWLALILLTDQFSRNIFRGTPRAFEFDPAARSLCLDGLQSGMDRPLRLIQRVFFYMPLEHSEDRGDQAQSVRLMRALVDEAPPPQREVFENYVDFARRHREIIDRFGRFPHRNRILGRQSSREEIEFLSQPGSSF